MANGERSATAVDVAGRGRWIGLAMLSLGVSMVMIDATIMNVAIPAIDRRSDPGTDGHRVGQLDLLARLRVAADHDGQGPATSSAAA